MDKDQLHDLVGVHDGAEVGALVFALVHGGDGHFHKLDALALHLQEHIGLVLEAFPLNVTEVLEILLGDGAQTCLGVGEDNAAAVFEQAGGELIAPTASGGDIGCVEVAAAHNDLVLMLQHRLGTGNDILAQVLTVAVDGHNALGIRSVLCHERKGVLQSAALALIYFMHQHMSTGHGSSLLKPCDMVGIAAVIDNDNIRKSFFHQTLYHAEELLVGVQRGENDGYICFIIRHTLPFHIGRCPLGYRLSRPSYESHASRFRCAPAKCSWFRCGHHRRVL